MTTAPGRFPFGWNRTTTNVTEQQAKAPLASGPVTIPITVYKDVFSGSSEIVVTEVTGGKEIALDGTFSNKVTNHEARIDALESTPVGDSTTALALEEIRTSSFVTLADSDETITKAQGLRRTISTLTAHRSKTLSKIRGFELVS